MKQKEEAPPGGASSFFFIRVIRGGSGLADHGSRLATAAPAKVGSAATASAAGSGSGAGWLRKAWISNRPAPQTRQQSATLNTGQLTAYFQCRKSRTPPKITRS